MESLQTSFAMAKLVIVLAGLLACALGLPHTSVIDSKQSWRIVGGQDAEVGEYPFIVSIRRYDSHSCGGSIINNRWIMTAAHCLQGVSASSLTVVAGSNTLDKGGVKVNVEKVIYHDGFDYGKLIDDIGLLKLAEPLDLESSDLIKPINRETVEMIGGEKAVLVGWGTTSYPGSIPNNLQRIDLNVLSLDQCKDKAILPVYDKQVCTLTKKGEGACHGDSGGPLVGPNNKQIGIVSWGNPCARGSPDVFTSVSSYNDWVDDKINANP